MGEPIRISWEGAPAHRFDWIGIYARDADPQVASYKDYLYTRGTLVGSATFRGGTVKHWPLRPGRYTAYLLVSDIYLDVAGVDFVIEALSGPRGGALAGTLGAWRRRSVWPPANCSRSSSHPVRRGSRSCTDVGTTACRSCRWTFDWVRTNAGG